MAVIDTHNTQRYESMRTLRKPRAPNPEHLHSSRDWSHQTIEFTLSTKFSVYSLYPEQRDMALGNTQSIAFGVGPTLYVLWHCFRCRVCPGRHETGYL